MQGVAVLCSIDSAHQQIINIRILRQSLPQAEGMMVPDFKA